MSKIFFAFCLVIISFLPTSEKVTNLENKLREEIDQRPLVKNEISRKDFQTAEYIEDFREITASSKAALFMDTVSGQILVEKNSNAKLPMASITKLMTALIVIEDKDVNEITTVPTNNTRFGDSIMGLSTGDRLTVYNLLQGLLITSGSDAALTLAKSVSGTEAQFVAKMNERATLLGLHDTQFVNSVGWDDPGHYSTAHDLAILTNIALKNSTIKEIIAKRSARVQSVNGKSYLLANTNLLLNNFYRGAKTGTTYAAGECLASYYVDDEVEIIGVILNSPDRFLETENLVKQIKNNFIFNRDKHIQN